MYFLCKTAYGINHINRVLYAPHKLKFISLCGEQSGEVFGILGLITSFKASMNFSISAGGKTIYEGPQGPEFSFGISPFGCEGTKIKIPNYGASVEVKI